MSRLPHLRLSRPLAGMMAAILSLPVVFGASPQANADTVVDPPLTPVADVWVSSKFATRNYGTANALWVDGSPTQRSYLRFNVPDSADPITKATLRLYLSDASRPVSVGSVANVTWDERTVTYNSAPVVGATLGSTGTASGAAWVSVNVTGAVIGAGSVSLAVSTSNGKAQNFPSRESGTNAAQLVIERMQADPTTTTTTTTPTTTTTTAPPTTTTTGPAGPLTYYVDDTAGSDTNAGTAPTSAWKTLSKASSATLKPSDSLLLKRGGVWTGQLSVAESGTATAKITIGAYGTGNRPVVSGASTCVNLSGSHLTVKDLEVRSCSWAGVAIGGSSNTLQDSRISDTAAGVHVKDGAVGNHVLRNQLVDNNRMSVLTTDPGDDSGAFAVLLNGDGTEVAYNSISGSDAFSYDYGRDGAAVEIYGARDSHVHHNIAFGNDAFTELGHSRSANNTFSYNLVHSSLASSIFVVTRGGNSGYGPVANTRLLNNTVYLTGASSQGFVCHDGCGPTILTMRNNVIQSAWKVGYADAAFDEDYNLYWGGQRQFVMGANSRVADPLFADAATWNLHLRPGSPGIDTGTAAASTADLDGSTVPLDGNGDGSAVTDRGAYEYRWTDTQKPAVTITSPANGTTVTGQGTVNSAATATDDTGVTKVEFYRDGALVGTDTAAPFTYAWSVTSADNGSHVLTASAYDAAGNKGDASPVTVTIAITTSTSGPAYYVDPTAGSDTNDGRSPTSAWRSLSKVNGIAFAAGDRVLFKRGQTWTGQLSISRSGTSSSPLTFGAYGEGALPRFTGTSSCIKVSGSYVVVTQLHADACTWAGFDIYGSNNRLEEARTTLNAAGIHVRSGAVGNRIVRNQVVDNNRMSKLTEGGDDDSGAFAILLHGDRTEVAYNTISGSDAFSYDYGRDGAAVEIYGSIDSHIHHNLAVDNHNFTELGNSRSANTVYAYNVVRSSLANSIFLVTRGSGSHWGPIYGTALYNNTVTMTGSGSQGFICHGGCGPSLLRMRNNVIQAVWKVGYADAAFDEDYNLYWGGSRQFTMGSHSKVADPRFVNLAAGDLHLQGTSAAVDAGTGVGYTADYDGRSVPADGNGDGQAYPDIGAFEYYRP